MALPWNTILLCQRHGLCDGFYAGNNEKVARDLHHIGLVRLLTHILLTQASGCCLYNITEICQNANCFG